ncbi:MAG: sigma-70 family RNA polymerase sigma factor [Pseudomonadota bacterium]|nr:sigma-70 family RNA polymerase sigma factor [Pseudomonadota bacterium]
MTALLTTLAATCIILSKAEQIARVRIIQDPASTAAEIQQATHDLVGANVRLAHKVAKQHVRAGLDFQDLLAQACEGIVYAAGKYDTASAASFTTYAKQWMRARCQEHVQANAGLLHCGSRTSKKLWSSLQKAQKAIGVDATPEAIAAHLSLDAGDVRACLASMTSRGVSIDKPVSDENGATIGSIIPDTALRQDVAMERTQNSESIASALESFAATLKPAHAEILRGRVIAGLTGDDQRCAKSFGVSKQRVGQIEKQLRSKLAAHFTRSFGADGVNAMLRASF